MVEELLCFRWIVLVNSDIVLKKFTKDFANMISESLHTFLTFCIFSMSLNF
jgi:hypothetical protein